MRFYLILFFSLVWLSSCGRAQSGEPATVIAQPGPNGTTCYLIYQGSEVKGGNCQ